MLDGAIASVCVRLLSRSCGVGVDAIHGSSAQERLLGERKSKGSCQHTWICVAPIALALTLLSMSGRAMLDHEVG